MLKLFGSMCVLFTIVFLYILIGGREVELGEVFIFSIAAVLLSVLFVIFLPIAVIIAIIELIVGEFIE